MAGAEEASLSRESRSNGQSTPLSPLFTTPTSIAAISVLIEFTHLNTTASGSRRDGCLGDWTLRVGGFHVRRQKNFVIPIFFCKIDKFISTS